MNQPSQENIQQSKEKHFWIELETTKSGYEKLSCRLNGKHFVGFLSEKERVDREGKVYGNYKLARMRECNWEDCMICRPNTILI